MSAEAAVDFLIVGQGLAGTLLARALDARNLSFRIVDRELPVSSSRVAAGLVHPVTGRRHAKSWMADTFLRFNETYYSELNKEVGQAFYHPLDGLEIASTVKDVNDWTARMEDPGLRHFLAGQFLSDEYEQGLQPAAGKFVMRQCGWMDLPGMLDYFRSKWVREQRMILTEFNPEELELKKDRIRFRDQEASAVVFCEGARARKNPLWSWLPFDPVKGEILTIQVPDLPQQHILFRGMFLVPIGNGLFKAGATYSWHQLDESPSEKGAAELREKLGRLIQVPYRILEHKAGLRPAVKGRRPLIGRHPLHTNVYLLNGFGSKGVMMGPWLTENFTDWLTGKSELLPEVDIVRFETLFPGQ